MAKSFTSMIAELYVPFLTAPYGNLKAFKTALKVKGTQITTMHLSTVNQFSQWHILMASSGYC